MKTARKPDSTLAVLKRLRRGMQKQSRLWGEIHCIREWIGVQACICLVDDQIKKLQPKAKKKP